MGRRGGDREDVDVLNIDGDIVDDGCYEEVDVSTFKAIPTLGVF